MIALAQPIVTCHQCQARAFSKRRPVLGWTRLPLGWRRRGGRATCPTCDLEA